jgi:hypothetical protein
MRNLVGAVGIEPTTFGLKGRCSTTELRPWCVGIARQISQPYPTSSWGRRLVMQIMPAKPYNLSILLKPYAHALKAYVIARHFRDSSRPIVDLSEHRSRANAAFPQVTRCNWTLTPRLGTVCVAQKALGLGRRRYRGRPRRLRRWQRHAFQTSLAHVRLKILACPPIGMAGA